MSLTQFVKCFFASVPVPALFGFRGREDEILTQFSEYKLRVPVIGAILLDEELKHCLLVKSVNYMMKDNPASVSWGFPMGTKLEEQEADIKYVARWVFEETSFDASALLKEKWNIQLSTEKGQRTKFYLVPGVDKATPFDLHHRSVNSETEYKWFPVEDLPTCEDGDFYFEEGGSKHKFSLVNRFTQSLREWIRRRKENPPFSFAKEEGGKGGGGDGGGTDSVAAQVPESQAEAEPVSKEEVLRKNLRKGETARTHVHPWANFRFRIEPIREGFRSSFGGQDWW